MPEALIRDLRLAARALLAAPAFLAIAVLTLALGIGSVAAVYSVVHGTLMHPLPYPDAGQIVRMPRVQGAYGGPVSQPAFEDWRAGTGEAFAELAAFAESPVNLAGAGEVERVSAYRVTPGFWAVMALPPAAGRYFDEADENAGERVAVLSHALWQRRYGSDPQLIGRDIQVNGQAHRVVGIAPPAFRYPAAGTLYLPTHLPAATPDRGTNYLSVLGRLRPGVTLEQAAAALATVNAGLAQAHPDEHRDLSARLVPLPELLVSQVRQPLLVLLGASALVLLIACANLANLMLARGNRRRRELAVRAALGADRRHLLRAVLAEAGLIALGGVGAGMVLAWLAVPALLAAAPDLLPLHSRPGLSGGALAITVAAGVATVLLTALWPAWRTASPAPVAGLGDEGRTSSAGRSRRKARAVLVVIEVALSLALLVGAGLLIESLRQLARVDTGIDADGVLTAAVVVPGRSDLESDFVGAYPEHTRMIAPRLDALRERVAAIPGVLAVGVTDALPLAGRDNVSSNIEVVGRAGADGGVAAGGANWRFVSPGYFAAIGQRVVDGRDLGVADQRPGEFPTHVLVNQAFARRYLDGEDAVGREIRFLGGAKTIAGVVSDVRQAGAAYEPVPEVYMTHANAVQTQFHLALKVAGDPSAFAETLRRALQEFDPAMPVFEVRALAELGGDGELMRRFNLYLLGLFSLVALVLAAVGLYGVVSQMVAERRHEFGIRRSLGAGATRLLTMVLGQGLALVAAGLVFGSLAALALGRLLASQLYGVAAAEPLMMLSVAALLTMVAALACLAPALRAARADPMLALRNS
ncbi:MAG: ABC transporter permease [Xanthomonadales bacterium]|nr:ABC transporter permease [Xanthomonadales bacterium]